MPWVLWDIMVPLLVTFLIGLGTGWLLWRWRRQKVNHVSLPQAATGAQKAGSTQAGESMNVVLIEERDKAVLRAEEAERELDSLKTAFERDVMGGEFNSQTDNESNISTGIAAGGSAGQEGGGDNKSRQGTAELALQVESLTAELEKEKASKAATDLALEDLNSRYKTLSATVDSFDSEDASKMREVADLENKYESSLQEIAEQKEQIAQLNGKIVGLENGQGALSGSAEAKLPDNGTSHNSSKVQQLSSYPADVDRANEFSVDESDLDEGTEATTLQATAEAATQVNSQATTQATTKDTYKVQTDTAEKDDQSENGARSESNDDKFTDAKPSGSEDTKQPGSQDPVSQDEVELPSTNDTYSANDAQSDDEESGVSESKTDGETKGSAASTSQPAEKNADQPAKKKVTSINAVRQKADAKKQPAGSNESANDSGKATATASGYVPQGWSVPDEVPDDEDRDNLRDIKGIGPVLEKMLHETGIYNFRQIALLDKNGVAELDSQIPQFSGRIKRDMWVQQAKTLHREKYGSAATRNVAS